jgi:HAD superfamily hydrolase (TIGR01549 family)
MNLGEFADVYLSVSPPPIFASPSQPEGRVSGLMSKVIFFDLGQTLITGAVQSPRRLVASRLGLSEKETRKVGRLIMTQSAIHPASLAASLRVVLVDRKQQHLQEAMEEIWEEQRRCVKEIDGAASVLSALKARGFKLGLLSNTWHPLYTGFCESCPDLAGLVDYVVLSYRLGCKKPSLDLFRKALEQAGEPAERCWMVGDSYELDIEPALASGMRTIWVVRAPEKEKTLLARVLRGEKPRPDWSVAQLEEILELFPWKGPL